MTTTAASPIFGPLRDRRFRLLWSGQAASQLGDSIAPIALALAIISATGSATDLGLVLAAAAVAEVGLFLPGGVWADRLPRRTVMLAAEIVRGVAQLVIGLELVIGDPSIPRIAVAAACAGAATAFFLPASTGLVPATVDTDRLTQANALLSVSKRTAYVIGPAVATALALTIGAGWALLIDAATFAVSAATLARLRIPRTPRPPRESFGAELRLGWREVRRLRWYWSNLISHCAWNLSRCVFFTVGPLVAVTTLGGEVAWGTIVQGGTIGALAGALIALRARPRKPLIAANLALALGALPLALLGAGAHPLLIAVAAGLMYSALGLMGVLWESTVQQHIRQDRISRVKAYDWLTSVGLNPLGMALAGPLAVAIGTSATLYGAAALIAVCCLGVLALPDVRSLTPRPEPVLAESAE